MKIALISIRYEVSAMSQMSDYDRFLKLEEDFNLFEFVVDGVKVWERIRFQVFNAITRRSIKGASAQLTKQSVLLRLKRLLFSIFAIKRNPLLTPRADFLFICSARRLHEADGLWWDIYTDPIMDALRSPFVAIETHFMNGHYRPEKTQTLRYFDFIDFISFILRATRIARANLTREDIRTIRRIEQKILKDFKFQLNVEELFRRTIEERKVRLPLYKLLLNRIRPNVVILAQGYGWETMVEACKSSTIPTIELQHGVISQESAAYSFPSDFRKKEMFADYLFVFGDFWKSSANFPIQKSHIISVGYPHFESERQKYSKLLKQKQILFISQAPVGEALSRIASELGSIKDFGYRILYKLHPLERDGWREKYPWLIQSEVEVIDQKEDIL